LINITTKFYITAVKHKQSFLPFQGEMPIGRGVKKGNLNPKIWINCLVKPRQVYLHAIHHSYLADRQVCDTLLAAGKVVKLVKDMRILGIK
jgi:hypothetical protein